MATNGSVEPVSASDNFWEIDGFKRTVRRTEDGMHQWGELMKMMQERAEIEKDYAKRLRVWCKKWADNAERGRIVDSYDFLLLFFMFDCYLIILAHKIYSVLISHEQYLSADFCLLAKHESALESYVHYYLTE